MTVSGITQMGGSAGEECEGHWGMDQIFTSHVGYKSRSNVVRDEREFREEGRNRLPLPYCGYQTSNPMQPAQRCQVEMCLCAWPSTTFALPLSTIHSFPSSSPIVLPHSRPGRDCRDHVSPIVLFSYTIVTIDDDSWMSQGREGVSESCPQVVKRKHEGVSEAGMRERSNNPSPLMIQTSKSSTTRLWI